MSGRTHRCSKCGKVILSRFSMCYSCHRTEVEKSLWRAYDEQTPEERELERERYYGTECVMCGKEGASERKDGKCYCSTCWMVWNS